MQKLMILNGSGDEATPFTRDSHQAAAEVFAKVMGHTGCAAFGIYADGTSKKLTEFDPNAEEVVLVGPYVGG